MTRYLVQFLAKRRLRSPSRNLLNLQRSATIGYALRCVLATTPKPGVVGSSPAAPTEQLLQSPYVRPLTKAPFRGISCRGAVKDEGLNKTREESLHVAREQRRFGERFDVEALVGSGGMGMVFRGRDRVDGQAVALKVLHRQEPMASERFLREAEALAALAHPAIVRYVAHGTTPQGEPYLAMEWLDGETLADRLARGAYRAGLAAARLGSRVLQALAVAHARGIVHRDIKPSNLFLPAADLDQVKLLDFGIARRTQDDWQVTRPGNRARHAPVHGARTGTRWRRGRRTRGHLFPGLRAGRMRHREAAPHECKSGRQDGHLG
jgi:hypothetical protein